MSCFLSLTDLKKRHFCVWGVLKIASQSHGAKKPEAGEQHNSFGYPWCPRLHLKQG